MKKCDHCSDTVSSDGYRMHVTLLHKDVSCSWFQCEGCSSYFDGFGSFVTHRSNAGVSGSNPCGRIRCNFCYVTFSKAQVQSFFAHVNQVHTKEAEKCWKLCLLCEKYFPSVDSLSKHIARSHKNGNEKSENEEILDQLVRSERPSSSVNQLTSRNMEKTPTKQFIVLPSVSLKHHQLPVVPSKKQKMSPPESSISPGSIVCKFCGALLQDFTVYFDHANKYHVDQISNIWKKCKYDGCGKYFTSLAFLSQHENRDHVVTSASVENEIKVDASSQSAQESQSQSSPSKNQLSFGQEGPIVCQYCNLSFRIPKAYHRHANKFHKNAIRTIWKECPFSCGMFLPSFKSLKSHMSECLKNMPGSNSSTDQLVIEGVKPIHPQAAQIEPECDVIPGQAQADLRRCQFCIFTFSSNQDYCRHAIEAHPDLIASSWFECQECRSFFPTRQELETHKITNHESVQPERGHQALGNQRLDVLARSLKKCPICSFPVQSGKEFHSHVNTEHLDVISSQWKNCRKCSQFFPSGLILKRHQEANCNNGDPLFSSFNDETSSGKGQTKCKFCSEMLPSKRAYYTHVNSKHLDVISKHWYQCNVCSLYFPSFQVRYQHIYNHHKNNTGTSPLQSNESVSSSMLAANSSALDGSVASFPNRKNNATFRQNGQARCNFCLAMFGAKSAYYFHVNKFHIDLVAKIWVQCHVCSMFYPSKRVRNNHMYMTHSYRKVSSEVPDLSALHQSSDKASGDDDTRPPQRLLPHTTREVLKVVPLNNAGNEIEPDVFLQEKNPTSANEQIIQPDSTVDISEFTLVSESVTSRANHSDETGHSEPTSRDTSVICHYCQICFEKSHDFYHHANLKHRFHLEKTWRLCQKCLWYFPTKKSLNNHGCDSPTTSTPEVPLRCQFCAFTFTSLSSEYFQHANKVHLKIISKAGWITCPLCHMFCPDQASLATHQKDCHRDESVAIEVEDEETNPTTDDSQAANKVTNLADDAVTVADEARIYVTGESDGTTNPTEESCPTESDDVEMIDLETEKMAEPMEEPIISCPLCRLEIKKTDSDITQHLYEVHGI